MRSEEETHTAAEGNSPGRPLPEITIRCRVEWVDTDASGHYHHGTVCRWVETAEAEMLRRIGIRHWFGETPRVHYEADYLGRAWFGDEIDLHLAVDYLGSSSLRMSFEALRVDQRPVARGQVVIVNAPADDGARAAPWPQHIRDAFGHLDGNREAAAQSGRVHEFSRGRDAVASEPRRVGTSSGEIAQ